MAPTREDEAFYARATEELRDFIARRQKDASALPPARAWAFGAWMFWERLFGSSLHPDFPADAAAFDKLFREWSSCA